MAKSLRVISFGWDDSTKFGKGVMSTNTQVEPHDAPGTVINVVQRGATLITGGGTSEAQAASIEEKIFAPGRHHLESWKAAHDKKYHAGSWAEEGGPDPESLGIHRLCEGTVLMGDNCNGAEKSKRLVSAASMDAAKAKIGEAAWEAMSEQERLDKGTNYIGRCQQHLRNTIINGMELKAVKSTTALLADDLGEFSSFERVSVDVSDQIRLSALQGAAQGRRVRQREAAGVLGVGW